VAAEHEPVIGRGVLAVVALDEPGAGGHQPGVGVSDVAPRRALLLLPLLRVPFLLLRRFRGLRADLLQAGAGLAGHLPGAGRGRRPRGRSRRARVRPPPGPRPPAPRPRARPGPPPPPRPPPRPPPPPPRPRPGRAAGHPRRRPPPPARAGATRSHLRPPPGVEW